MDLKEKGYNRRERMEWLVIMLVVSLLCMIPCMGKLLPQGDDMTFHILRIESVYHAIKTGQGFPAYIYDKLLEGYGYGAGIFYPDILLLPAILLRFMGIEDENKLKTSRSHEGIYFLVAVTDLLYIIPGRKSNWKKSFCGACYDGIVYNGTLSFGRYIQTVGNGRSCRHGIHSSGISGIV